MALGQVPENLGHEVEHDGPGRHHRDDDRQPADVGPPPAAPREAEATARVADSRSRASSRSSSGSWTAGCRSACPATAASCSGDSARVSSTTVGYRPTHTAIDVLVSEGGGASAPVSSNANQLPNELSMVRNWKSLELLAFGQKPLPLGRVQPRVRGPPRCRSGTARSIRPGCPRRAEQLGAAEARESCSPPTAVAPARPGSRRRARARRGASPPRSRAGRAAWRRR